MSRSRKAVAAGEVDVVEAAGNGAALPPPIIVAPGPDSPGPDPWAEIARLQAALNDSRVAHADANRLMDQLKIQRNAAMDEIMLLRAQLKVAVEDGNAGWAAASAARGPTH